MVRHVRRCLSAGWCRAALPVLLGLAGAGYLVVATVQQGHHHAHDGKHVFHDHPHLGAHDHEPGRPEPKPPASDGSDRTDTKYFQRAPTHALPGTDTGHVIVVERQITRVLPAVAVLRDATLCASQATRAPPPLPLYLNLEHLG